MNGQDVRQRVKLIGLSLGAEERSGRRGRGQRFHRPLRAGCESCARNAKCAPQTTRRDLGVGMTIDDNMGICVAGNSDGDAFDD